MPRTDRPSRRSAPRRAPRNRSASSLAPVQAGPARVSTGDARPKQNGRSLAEVGELRRQLERRRVLVAMTRLACHDGLHSVTVAQILDHARVARSRFYDLFEDREACLLAVFDEAVATAEQRVRARVDESAPWADRLRDGLLALLEFFDEEPELARVCIVHVMAGERAVHTRRRQVLFDLVRHVDCGRAGRRSANELPPLTAEGVVGALFSLIYNRLLAPEQTLLTPLLNQMMAIAVLPYQGAAAAQQELSRPPAVSSRRAPKRLRKAARDPLAGLQMRLTPRTICVLGAIARSPGASNREIADSAGVGDQGQISKLLARLEGLGLMLNSGPGHTRGGSNAWTLTARGSAMVRSLGVAGAGRQTPKG